MVTVHAVLRNDGEGWRSYSEPFDVYVGGRTADEARARFREALDFHTETAGETVDRVEFHYEQPVAHDVFVRSAGDAKRDARQQVADLIRQMHVADTLPRDLPAATGDTVVIACVPDDRLGWLHEQFSDHDTVHVALGYVVPGRMHGVWIGPISGLSATGVDPADRTLADAGLDDDSTVGDLAAAVGVELPPAGAVSAPRPLLVPA